MYYGGWNPWAGWPGYGMPYGYPYGGYGMPYDYPYGGYGMPYGAMPKEEIAMLEDQERQLTGELDGLRKRLEELRK